jgi:hypothetical protein
MNKVTIIDKFIGCFKDITFNIICKPIRKNKVSKKTLDSSEKDLKKMLAKAKRDLSKAKKSHKHNKMSSEELFEHEYRVSEIFDAINKLDEDSEEI